MTETEKSLVRELQSGLPLVPRPFAELATRTGLTEKEVLAKVQEFKEKGYLKRISAALRHQKVGYVANAMVVWQIPSDRIAEVGTQLAQQPEVSHCYQRKVLFNWPYNLYTMLHGQTREEIYGIIQEMSNRVQVTDYRVLFSTQELKKSSMQYFVEG